MLSPLDDYPIHQVAEPMRFVGTSDRNFYDRYYFNAMPLDGSFVLVCGLGSYPNRDVCDAFCSVSMNGTQRVVRASRQLGSDRMDLGCGPLRIDIEEPMQRVRFRVAPGGHDLDVDLTWTGSMVAQIEPDQQIRHGAQLTTDTKRFVQTCRIEGHVSSGGRSVSVDRSSCWGNRDRSWGVRTVGEPEAPGSRADLPGVGFFWIYAIAQFDEFSIVAMIQENRDGARAISHARRYWHDGRPADDLGYPRQRDVELVDAGRRFRSASIDFVALDGTVTTMAVQAGPTAYLGLGTGYGVDLDWRHGMWQGVGPVVQERVFDLNDPEVLGRKLGLHDNLGRFTFEGEQGIGLLEFAVMGRYHPLGL